MYSFFHLGFALALALVCQPVAGLDLYDDPQDGLSKTAPVPQKESANQTENGTGRAHTGHKYIDSLLVDKEFPHIGGRWGADLFVDLPLNDEPADADITLRRARLKYSHSFGENWKLKLSADYNSNAGFQLSDNYVSYSGWSTRLLTIGVHKPPFSLESVSSATGWTFMEKSMPVTALSERRGSGINLLKRTDKNILNAALVLYNPPQDHLREKGQAFMLHYVYSPINLRGRKNMHLGGSFSYRPNADEDNTRFRSRPEINTTNMYFVDTGEITGADKVIRASLEASRIVDRFSWQAELLSTQVQRDDLDSIHFWGAYVYVSWFLSNDSRNYDAGSGKFGPLKPSSPMFKGGRGAFELAFRASFVDLTDKDVIGGEESNLSLGFNWYLNNKLRIMTNVVKVLDVKRPGSEYDGQNPLIFALRAQWLIN